MAADDKHPILFSKIAQNEIKIKPGNVVVSQADPHRWILQKHPIRPSDSWDPSTISTIKRICLIDNHTNLVWLLNKVDKDVHSNSVCKCSPYSSTLKFSTLILKLLWR